VVLLLAGRKAICPWGQHVRDTFRFLEDDLLTCFLDWNLYNKKIQIMSLYENLDFGSCVMGMSK